MKKPTLKHYRRGIQIGVAVAFIIIPWLNHLHISVVFGNFLSFRFLDLPLADPLAVAQISLKNGYLSPDLLIGAGIALAAAAILGTVFCSWICPFGLMSELSQTVFKRGLSRRRWKLRGLHRWGFAVKLWLFVLGLVFFFIFSTTPILNQLSLPAWYSRIFQFWFEQWHISLALVVLLAVILVEGLSGSRWWCRYICPQSVLIVLAKQLNPMRLKVRFDTLSCICKGKTDDPCTRACSLSLDPKKINIFPETECTNCGDCVVACKKRGRALTFKFGRSSK